MPSSVLPSVGRFTPGSSIQPTAGQLHVLTPGNVPLGCAKGLIRVFAGPVGASHISLSVQFGPASKGEDYPAHVKV